MAMASTEPSEFQHARQLWQGNRFEESLDLFERAVRLYPDHPAGVLDAARAFGTHHRIGTAESWLDRMLQLAGNDPALLHLAGQTYRMIFRPDKAMALFERVIEATSAIPDAFLEVALLYERHHRLDDAFDMIVRCRKAAPAYREPILVEARLHRRMGREDTAEGLLRKLTKTANASLELQARAFADLAELYDRQGRYDRAMQAIQHCKALQLKTDASVKQVSDLLTGHLQGLFPPFHAEQLRHWCDGIAVPDRVRVALLAGFPRSGTTLLEQVFDAHPGLISSEELEVFSRDIFPAMWRTGPDSVPTYPALNGITPGRLAELRRKYLLAMEEFHGEPLGGRVLLDKNPVLTLLLPPFLRLLPESNLIMALRDPRDVVLSCYLRYLPLNTNSVWFLTLPRTAERYRVFMQSWLELRAKLPDNWIEVRYEDVVDDFETQVHGCLRQLGLAWDDGVRHYRDRVKTKPVASPTYESVAQPIYKTAVGRWQHYEAHLAPVLKKLDPFLREFGYR